MGETSICAPKSGSRGEKKRRSNPVSHSGGKSRNIIGGTEGPEQGGGEKKRRSFIIDLKRKGTSKLLLLTEGRILATGGKERRNSSWGGKDPGFTYWKVNPRFSWKEKKKIGIFW